MSDACARTGSQSPEICPLQGEPGGGSRGDREGATTARACGVCTNRRDHRSAHRERRRPGRNEIPEQRVIAAEADTDARLRAESVSRRDLRGCEGGYYKKNNIDLRIVQP